MTGLDAVRNLWQKWRKMKTEVTMSPSEIETLVDWVKTFDPPPHQVRIIAASTGIGNHLRAEVDQGDGEGRWKDITDYENW
jgi:hypothetical protein